MHKSTWVNTHQESRSHSQTNSHIVNIANFVKSWGCLSLSICPFHEMSKLAFKRLTLKFSIAYFVKCATKCCSFHEMGNKFGCSMKCAILLRISWNEQNCAYFMKWAVSRITRNIYNKNCSTIYLVAGQYLYCCILSFTASFWTPITLKQIKKRNKQI